MTIYVVIVPNRTGGTQMILAAYTNEVHADMHVRTVTGSRVLPLEVHEQLLPSVIDDIASEDWEEGLTPVQEPEVDTIKTQPSTPRAKSRSKPPR